MDHLWNSLPDSLAHTHIPDIGLETADSGRFKCSSLYHRIAHALNIGHKLFLVHYEEQALLYLSISLNCITKKFGTIQNSNTSINNASACNFNSQARSLLKSNPQQVQSPGVVRVK